MSDSNHTEIRPLAVHEQQSQLLNSINPINFAAGNGTKSPEVADSMSDSEKAAFLPGTLLPAKHPEHTVDQLSTSPDIVPHNEYISWGIGWRLPLTMILFFIGGILAVCGHHIYYSRLNGSTAGDTAAQQWVLWIGTGFTFLTLFFLNTGNGIAFSQHVWRLIKLHGFSIKDLDKLFSATADITAFFSFALWRHAGSAMILACLLWCLALTTVVPPGSITVVPGGLQQLDQQLQFQSFNWTNIIRGQDDCGILICEGSEDVNIAYPNPITVKLASQVTEGIAVMPIPSPASNYSFRMEFFGPALACEPATTSQQASFDFYNEAAYQGKKSLTGPQYLDGKHNSTEKLLYYSAFSPQLYGFINVAAPVPGIPDTYNNWNASLPGPYFDNFDSNTAELWVQLANDSLVCSLWNASYNVGFDYPNGVQNITHRRVTFINQWTGNISYDVGGPNYMGVLASIAPMLYGNVSILRYDCQIQGNDTTCYMLSDTSSKILSSGVVSCPEFTHSFWQDHVANGKSQSEQPDGSFLAFSSWECRNHSVALAIEDLFANYTISLLSTNLSNFSPQVVTVDGFAYSSINVYSYDARPLLASYGAAVGVSLILVIVGVYSFWKNGISHDSSFSALMTTTRNPELDFLTKGQSLGPLEESLEETILRFGAVAQSSSYEATRRAAFGLEGSVVSLKKGQKYI